MIQDSSITSFKILPFLSVRKWITPKKACECSLYEKHGKKTPSSWREYLYATYAKNAPLWAGKSPFPGCERFLFEKSCVIMPVFHIRPASRRKKPRATPHNSTRNSARDFVPVQRSENAGILYVFPVFGTAELAQKIR